MDFKLSKEQEMLRKLFRDFAQNEVKPLAALVDEEEMFPEETVKKMAKLGMCCCIQGKSPGSCYPDSP